MRLARLVVMLVDPMWVFVGGSLGGIPTRPPPPPRTESPAPSPFSSKPVDSFFLVQRDAFVLFVERMRPRLFESWGGAQGQASAGLGTTSPRPYLATARGGAGGDEKRAKPRVVRSYRSEEESWARSRRMKVPARILEELLAAWRAGTEGLTPAEYGAAFIGQPEVTWSKERRRRRGEGYGVNVAYSLSLGVVDLYHEVGVVIVVDAVIRGLTCVDCGARQRGSISGMAVCERGSFF